MESSKKSIPSEKPKEKKKSPPKKKNKSPSKAKTSQSQSSSSKNGPNSNQSAGKPSSSRHSDHSDRRERYHYSRHQNQRNQRERSHYNSNYDSERNKRPYQGWSSSGGSSYGNRVWKRPYSSHSNNDRYQKFNNFQKEGAGNNYHKQHPRHSSDSFRNFQPSCDGSSQNNPDNSFESSENQNFWQDSIVGQFPVPEALASVIQCAAEILNRSRCDPGEVEPGNQSQQVAFNTTELLTIDNQTFEIRQPEETITPDQPVQINENYRPPKQINEDLEQEFLTIQNQELGPDQELEQIHENYLQGLLANQNQAAAFDQLEQFSGFQSEQAIDQSTNYLFANIKNELPESEFNLEKCINSDNSFPSISVIPISRLIKSEIQDLNRPDIIAPTTPNKNKRSLKPNLVQRKKSITKDGSLSENIVQRVANMDKVGIKNVINSSGTKYDAALKIQARKKLREEIRKQLKSMNFTPKEDNGNNVLIPDEIVDSMSIPAVVLDEIRKAFGIVLVEDKNSKIPDGAEKKSVSPPAISAEEPVKEPSERSPKSPDLMSRIKMLEECKSQSEKTPPIKEEKARRSKSSEPIVIIDSSSSSSSGSSSSSDSDTSSTSSGSNCSNSSSFKRRRRKKRILEANVVGNFEKLILPNLTVAQRRRYKEKYSKTTKNSLLYIYGVCVSRANRNNTSADEKEQLKVKKNLSSADNGQALEFLMKAILSLFEKQKETLKKSKANKTQTAKPQIKSPNPVSATANKSKDSTCSQRHSDDDDKVTTRRRSESASSVEFPKHQSAHKLDKASTEGRVNKRHEDSIGESANSAKRVSSDDGAPVALELESDTESTSGKNPPSRLWKSPGEKKCIEIDSTSPLSNIGTLKSPPSEIETAMSSLGMMQSPLANYPFDIESLKSQSSIGDAAVSSIREIDVKLMELHKRKMYIEEMILKLQKDKMEVDLWTMKLQNEKFILLNSALASVSSNSASPKAVSEKIKILSKPFLDKIQHSKKRTLTDNSEEDTEDAIKNTISARIKELAKPFANKIQPIKKRIVPDNSEEDTEDAIKSTAKPRQTKRKLVRSKNEDKSEAPKRTRSSKKLIIPDSSDAVSSEKESNSEQAVEPPKKIEKLEEEEEDVKTEEVPQVDYTNVPNGNLEGWKLPITQIIVIGEAIVAASEDGNIYKFNIRTRVLESKFSKHTEAITQIFTCPKENFVYTTSLDGFLKKTSIENFGLELQSVNLQEPLQSIDIEWGTAFIGSRWGNIFTYDIKNNSLSESLLCSSGSSIIAIRATKEGPRKILIVSSKGNQINFRDAMTGLLLRSLDVPDNLHIYSILLDEGCVYCGTQRNEIHQYNFTTGGRLAIFNCGNGAVSMKLYKDRYIFVGCYDGFVYVLDKKTGCQIGRFPGSGKMILALEIAGDKLITSAKDNTMQIIDIPKYIATIKDKS